jgi:hypothetical protein
LFDDGFGPTSIAVLTETSAMATRIRQLTVGNYSFGAWGGRGVPVETISRFKGLEAEAVVLVLEGAGDRIDQKLAYVGMSRARSMLVVVARPSLKRALNWPYANELTKSK